MSQDFTIQIYKKFINAILAKKYKILPCKNFFLFENGNNHLITNNFITLRHDVDIRPLQSLAFAKIQFELGLHCTYYFRIVPSSFNEIIIKTISSLGHEIGYHYETMDLCKGDMDKAYTEFCKNLDRFRKIVPIETICMHGSPLSKFDNRAIWEKYDYKQLGIIGEPYFDLNFSKTCYLTDTGRRWDGGNYSVRDKPFTKTTLSYAIKKEVNTDAYSINKIKPNLWPKYHRTSEIINSIENESFPKQAMITFHPQRWSDNNGRWATEFFSQNIKNIFKRIFYV